MTPPITPSHFPAQLADHIEMWSTARLLPYASNPRIHSQPQIQEIADSIREFGLNRPVLVDPDGTIIAGHAITSAARNLGLEQVPVIVLSHRSKNKGTLLAQKADLDTSGQRVIHAITDGQITPTEGETVVKILEPRRRILETVNLDRQLKALDGKRAGRPEESRLRRNRQWLWKRPEPSSVKGNLNTDRGWR